MLIQGENLPFKKLKVLDIKTPSQKKYIPIYYVCINYKIGSGIKYFVLPVVGGFLEEQKKLRQFIGSEETFVEQYFLTK